MPNASILPVVSSGIQSALFTRVQGRSDHQLPRIISVFRREHQAGSDEAQSQELLVWHSFLFCFSTELER